MKKRIRGRFDIVCPMQDGAYVRMTSRKDRSLSRKELVAELKRMIAVLEAPDQKKAS